jgi:hypothetical protein
MKGQKQNAQAVRAAILESALGCEHQEVPDCRRLLAGRLKVSGAVSRILGGNEDMSNQAVQPATATKAGSTTNESEQAPVNGAVMASVEEDRSAIAVEDRPPAGPTNHRSGRPWAAVTASDCACKNKGELVYAIGDLDIDFGTLARLDSLQQNADGFLRGGRLDVRINGHFIRHLLGWRDFATSPTTASAEGEGKDAKTQGKVPAKAVPKERMVIHKPHLYDAQAVIWVLRQDESPVYAIRPSGPFAEDGYLELIHFLMEQEGYEDDAAEYQEKDAPPVTYYPSLDTHDRAEPNRTTDAAGRPVRIIERVAIPGTLDGTAKLYNGSVVPVICPDMRGTRSWSMERLLAMHVNVSAEKEEQRRERQNLERVAQRFFEEARNSGLSPEERAVNFAATRTFRSVPDLRVKFGRDVDWELNSISVKPSPTCREDSECYDVETAFFDPENVLRAKIVLAQTFDVSDVVPVMLGDDREFRRT